MNWCRYPVCGSSLGLASFLVAALLAAESCPAWGQPMEIPPAPATFPAGPAPGLSGGADSTEPSKIFIPARAIELWQDKPLGELHASISLDPAEPLSESELAKLDQAGSLLATNGDIAVVFGDSRPWLLNTYEWEAPATRHLPLLFEEPNLERLGYTAGVRTYWKGCEGSIHAGDVVQPFVSAAHFFGRVPAVPYLCGLDDPFEPIYTLGVDRPGSPLLYRRHLIPFSLRGALFEAAAVIGLAYAIP